MVGTAESKVVNAGEQITTPPSPLPLKPDEQFRMINQRIDALSADIGKIAKPPPFNLANVVQILAIVLGFVVTVYTALGLSERISDVSTHQADAERRIEATVGASELRLATKLDKLNDQFTSMDERTSRIEGEQSAKAAPHSK
jgi:hypothetical protein